MTSLLAIGPVERMTVSAWFLTFAVAPVLIDALGRAGKDIVGENAKIVTAAISSIDNITVFDTGHGNGGDGALERMLATGPGTFLQLLKMLEATGLSPVLDGLLAKAGIDIKALGSMVPASHTPTEERPAAK